MPITRHFGRVFRPDPRDAKYRLRARKSQREQRTWRTGWKDNQGLTPRCVGSALCCWLGCFPISQWLDPQGIYNIAKRFDEWEGEDYEGTSVRAGFAVLKELRAVYEYRWATNANTVANHILEVGPVVVGTNWYESMDYPNSRGYIEVEGEVLGGHAYCLTGYSRKSDEFTFANSWGPTWGHRGFGRISRKNLNRLIKEDGEACVGIERRLAA